MIRPDNGGHAEAFSSAAAAGWDELRAFIETTLHYYTGAENVFYKERQSLLEFARVDIGYWENEDGSVDYFVNEVERGVNVYLWVGEMTMGEMDCMAKRLAEALHRWIVREKGVKVGHGD